LIWAANVESGNRTTTSERGLYEMETLVAVGIPKLKGLAGATGHAFVDID